MKHLGKFILISLSICLLLAGTFLAFLPMILSSHFGTELTLSLINKHQARKVSIESLSLHWLSSQQISGLTIEDKEAKTLFSCQNIQANAPLWKMLFTRSFGEIKLYAPQFKMQRDFKDSSQSGSEATSRGAALTGKENASSKKSRLPSGKVLVQEGLIEISSAGMDPVLFDQLCAEVDIPVKGSSLLLNLGGKTEQGSIVGKFELQALFDHLTSSPLLDLKAKLLNLPMRGLDQLLSLFCPDFSGLLLEAIGPSMTLDLIAKASSDSLEVSFDAQSSQMQAHLQTASQNGGISLKAPATASFLLSPSFAQRLFKLSPFFAGIALKNTVSAQISLEELWLPLVNNGIDIKGSAFRGTLDLSPFQLFSSSLASPFAVQSFHALLSSQNFNTALNVDLSSKAQFQQFVPSLSFRGTWEEILLTRQKGSFEMGVKELPLALLSPIFENKETFPLLLGPSLDFDLKASFDAQGQHLSLRTQTPQFELPEVQFLINKEISLNAPATLTFIPSVALLKELSLGLDKPTPIRLRIESFSFPSFLRLEEMQLQASLEIPQVAMHPFFSFQAFPFGPLTCQIGVKGWQEISLLLKSELLQGQMECALKKDPFIFTLKKPLSASYTLTDDQLKTLFSKEAHLPLLLQPARLDLRLSPFTLPLSDWKWNTLALQGELLIKELSMGNREGSRCLSLENVSLNFQGDGKADKALFSLAASTKESQGKGASIQADLSCEQILSEKGIDLSTSLFTLQANLLDLPSTALETLLGKPDILSPFLGSSLTLRLKAISAAKNQTISLKATSQLLTLDGAFSLGENALQLQKDPFKIAFTLSEQGYLLLDSWLTKQTNHPFQLLEPGTVSFSLSKFTWPLLPKNEEHSFSNRFPSFSFLWPEIQLKGEILLDKFSLFEKATSQSMALQGFSLSLDKSIPASPFTFHLQSQVSSQPAGALSSKGTAKEGSVRFDGSLSQLFSEKGEWNPNGLCIQIEGAVQHLPIPILDAFSRGFGASGLPFTTLFGDSLNATLSTQIQNLTGPLSLNLNSLNTRASLKGRLDNGRLLLDEPLYAQLTMTPELSAALFKEVNPLSITAVISKNPITLEIKPEGFSLPLHPFDKNRIIIPQARIELGQIKCYNEGNLSITLGLLRSRQLSKEKELKLWFAPIDLHIQNGQVDWERTEILVADTFEIALWGGIDLVRDSVDMVLGLTAQCLKRAFGIKDLPQNYVLQIPLRGKMDNVQINTTKATSKIALLLAWQQKSALGALGGGPGGAILGDLLGKVGVLPDMNVKAPPPKRPFPWETSHSEEEEGKEDGRPLKKTYDKKSRIKKGDKPLKQILRILRS